MAESGGGSLSVWRCWALFQLFFFTCLIRSPRSRQVHLGSFPWSSALKKILTSLPGLQQWVVVGCKPGCRLVGAAQHIWPWLLLLSSFCSPTIPWEWPACSLWFCSTNKALFIHAEKESELIWATGWEWSYGLMPVELPSHTAAPLHPGHRDHRGQASKWETHHSCGSLYTRIHFWSWFGKRRNVKVDIQVDVVLQWIYPSSYIQGQMEQMNLNLDSELETLAMFAAIQIWF